MEQAEQRGVRSILSAGALSWVNYVLLLVALFGAYGVAARVSRIASTAESTIEVQLSRSVEPGIDAVVPAGARVLSSYANTAEVVVAEPEPGWRALAGVGPLVAALAVVVGALLLRRVLRTIESGRPFHPANARRIAGVAGTIAVGTTGASLAGWLGTRAVLAHTGLDPNIAAMPIFDAAGPLSVGGLLVAVVVLAVAEAFRRGRRIAEDTDGLV